MRTHAAISLYGAKVIKSPRDKDVVTLKTSKAGDEYATFLAADIEGGGVYRIVCFDQLAKQAKNMGLVANEDTICVNGVLDLMPIKDNTGKMVSQYVRIKANMLAYGPKLINSNEKKEAKESEALAAADIFKNGIPSGRPFQ